VVVLDEMPPVVLSLPQNLTNGVGTTAILQASATACTPLSFQWLFDNATVLTNETNATLTIASVLPANAGTYSIIAGSSGGISTGLIATLSVDFKPATLTVSSSANPDGGLNLKLAGAPGLAYILESSMSLSLPANWLPIATNILGADGVWQFDDASPTSLQQRFYRLRLAP
jgi:hypothetical protein